MLFFDPLLNSVLGRGVEILHFPLCIFHLSFSHSRPPGSRHPQRFFPHFGKQKLRDQPRLQISAPGIGPEVVNLAGVRLQVEDLSVVPVVVTVILYRSSM